jgi:hypothetical protein
MVRICIIQGHPTRGGGHFCHAMAVKPRRSILVGMIEAMSDNKRRAWLHRLNALGRAAA